MSGKVRRRNAEALNVAHTTWRKGIVTLHAHDQRYGRNVTKNDNKIGM